MRLAQRPRRARHGERRGRDPRLAGARSLSPRGCTRRARCSSASCSSCIAPASCAAAPTTACPSSGMVATATRPERSMQQALALLRGRGRGPVPDAAQFATLRHTACSAGTSNSRTAACARRAAAGSRRTSPIRRVAHAGRECLGSELRNGQVLHAGFFLGPRGFYAALREMPESRARAVRHARRRSSSTSCTAPIRSCASCSAARALHQHLHDGDAARGGGVRRPGERPGG